jgi:hypothetical protein
MSLDSRDPLCLMSSQIDSIPRSWRDGEEAIMAVMEGMAS